MRPLLAYGRNLSGILLIAVMLAFWPLTRMGVTPPMLSVVIALLLIFTAGFQLFLLHKRASLRVGWPLVLFSCYVVVLLMLSVFHKGPWIIPWSIHLVVLCIAPLVSILEGEGGLKLASRNGPMVITIASLVMLIMAFSNAHLWEGITHQATYQVKGWFSHRNFLAQWLAIPVAILLSGALKRGVPWMQRAAFFLLVAGAMAMLSRSGWINLFVVFLAWVLYRKYLPGHVRSIWNRRFFSWSIVVLALGLLWMVDQPFTLWHQLETLWSGEGASVNDRMALAARSVELFGQAPLGGVGLGQWPWELLKLSQEGMQSANGIDLYENAHSDGLEILAESGWVAAALWMLTFLAVVPVMRLWHKEGKHQRVFLVAVCWLVWLVAAWNNHPRYEPIFVVGMGVLLGLTRHQHAGLFLPARFTGLVLLTSAGAVALIFGYHHWHAQPSDRTYEVSWVASLQGVQSFSYESLQDPNSKSGIAMVASDDRKAHPLYAWNQANETFESGQRDSAMAWMNALLDRFPSHRDGNLLMAQMHCEAGQTRAALNHMLAIDLRAASADVISLGSQIAQDSLAMMQNNHPERKLMLTIQAMANTPVWAFSVLQKASINELSFEQQAWVDAIYFMGKECPDSTCPEIIELREKYIPDLPEDLE